MKRFAINCWKAILNKSPLPSGDSFNNMANLCISMSNKNIKQVYYQKELIKFYRTNGFLKHTHENIISTSQTRSDHDRHFIDCWDHFIVVFYHTHGDCLSYLRIVMVNHTIDHSQPF